MFIKSRLLLASSVSLLALAACSSSDSPSVAGSAKHPIAATVNGTPISEHLVGMMLKQRTDLGRPAGAEARKTFIDNLAMQVIITQEAVKKGLDKVPEVSDRIELGRQSILIDAFVQDYLKNNAVSDDMLNAEYEKIKTQTSGSEYKARHILVESEAEAKDIVARLKKNPKAFESLAKEKSKDRGSKANGGDLGWFDPRGMVPEFGAAVARLAKGQFTDEPVKSQFGYHVILLEDSRPRQVQPLEQIKPALTQQVQQQNLKKLFDEMKAKAKIEIVQAPAPASDRTQEAKPAESAKK
ncbi:MAG: peptidylprolyl isomerase [Betaproteobacteria bacterium]|nr:MAG: peptidylprolyl isomerase [Betaproteobacteria bacterium]